MVRMLLAVLAVVLAVRVLLNLFRSSKSGPSVKGTPRSQASDRKYDDIEDAEFKEIK
ncbi:MAG: hypothetical protein H6508_06100 [Calditrichaeota bacterium]|nr:hypothetical protein [Calditrichota bacterium]MCB9366734.1 hypothetical protein [Calditrichota bacterium]